MKLLDRLFGKTKDIEKPSETGGLQGKSDILTVTPQVQLQIGTCRGITGVYTCVQMFNPNLPQWGWRDISPRYREFTSCESCQSRARSFLNNVLLQNAEEIGAKRILFLECLQRHCAENHIDWFFFHVLSMMEYFSTCFVKDRSVVEICVCHQMADMGDEFFNMAYSVGKELGLKPINDIFNMSILAQPLTQEEYTERGYDQFSKGGLTHRRLLHVGSDVQGLMQVHWIVDLKDVKGHD